jgi:hypothetical protein
VVVGSLMLSPMLGQAVGAAVQGGGGSRGEPARPRGGLWQIGPRALGGAAALGVGAYLGLMLVAGGGVALRPASMSVFSGEPPGAYCAGLPSCSARGR